MNQEQKFGHYRKRFEIAELAGKELNFGPKMRHWQTEKNHTIESSLVLTPLTVTLISRDTKAWKV